MFSRGWSQKAHGRGLSLLEKMKVEKFFGFSLACPFRKSVLLNDLRAATKIPQASEMHKQQTFVSNFELSKSSPFH